MMSSLVDHGIPLWQREMDSDEEGYVGNSHILLIINNVCVRIFIVLSALSIFNLAIWQFDGSFMHKSFQIGMKLQLVVIPSNRTPNKTIELSKEYFTNNRTVIDVVDKSAYLSSLALSKYLVVTCDSTSMISEAALTGKPVYVAMIPALRNDKRFQRFRSLFEKLHIIKILENKLETWNYEKLNEADRIALEIKRKIN